MSNPSSKMKPIIIGTAVKTPIWTKNWAFKAASSAVFPEILAFNEMAESSPESAYKYRRQVDKRYKVAQH